MIVCHCNRIDHTAIEAAADRLAREDQWRLITPVAVYKALGYRPRCGGCLPLAANVILTRDVGRERGAHDCPLAVLAGECDDALPSAVPAQPPRPIDRGSTLELTVSAPRPCLDAAE